VSRETHDVGVLLQHLQDTSPRERLLPKPRPDVAQDPSLDGIRFVEDTLESGVGGTETVEEVLGEDPAGVSVGGFLNGEFGAGEEGVGGEDELRKGESEQGRERKRKKDAR
jgi:hypothetical protein